MAEGFVKLFSSLPESSIWCADYPTRIVWITMLAMAEKDGFVGASVPGLARRANVTVEECGRALQVLLDPDPDSRNPDNDGRRIEVVERGWQILNYAKFREMRDMEQKRTADRRRQREKRKRDSHGVTGDSPEVATGRQKSPNVAQAEAEAEAEADAEAEAEVPPTTPPSLSQVRTVRTVPPPTPEPIPGNPNNDLIHPDLMAQVWPGARRKAKGEDRP